jgi:hypothetical protein
MTLYDIDKHRVAFGKLCEPEPETEPEPEPGQGGHRAATGG